MRSVSQDDYGWADAGWHRVDVRSGAGTPDPDVQTPNMDALIKEGIEMDRQYVCKPAASHQC
jgi:arylsulfatase A-like enzyme